MNTSPTNQRLWARWLPQTFAARVFLVFSSTTFLGMVIGLALLNYQQFNRHVAETRASIAKLAAVTHQPITESAVVGDYDAIARLLRRIVPESPLREAVFLDAAGGSIRAGNDSSANAPAWLASIVADSVPDLKQDIAIGGRHYGQLVLRYDPALVADDLWSLLLKTAGLGILGLAVSMVVTRYAIRRWLRTLDNLQTVEAEVLAGTLDAQVKLPDDAPLEIRKAIEVVNRTAGSLRTQFGQRIDTLMHSLIQHKNAMDVAAIVCELDPQGRLTSANEAFLRAVGLPLGQLQGRTLHDIDQPQASTGVRAIEIESTHKPWQPSRENWRGDVQVIDGQGAPHFHRRTVVPIFDGSNEVEKYICIAYDITAQKASEQALIDHVHRQSITTTFGQQALEWDDQERLMRQAVTWACTGLGVNHAALVMQDDATAEPRIQIGLGWAPGWVGRPAQRLPNHPGSDLRLTIPDEMLQTHGMHSLLAVPSEAGSEPIFTLLAASQSKPFTDADRDFLHNLAHALSAALERHRSRERLTYLARFDGLTGLPNRGLLFDRLEHVLAAARSQGTRVALMYLDLDRFKLVNDTLGHEAGDHLLVQAAHRMVSCLRASDTVARLAGDEFAILLPGLEGHADVENVGRKVLAQLTRPFDINGKEVFISASVGAVVYPDHGLDAASMVRCADQAMYHAKHTGRNELRFYSEEMNTRESDRLEIGTRLRAALERQEFKLVYQPRVSLTTGRISGMEALLRWTHPERGPISPVEFVPVLEDTGLIIGVGEWVLREAAQQVVRWQAMGLAVPSVAVNLSARQFASPELDSQVRAVLRETGVDPSMLEFELTESMLMHEPAKAVATLEHFRSYGLRLSVDDFGTGYSSLSYLRRFPLDALKVDRAFVRDLATNADDMAITLAIISMAHSLKLKVVAEGVETAEQLDLLASAGCDEIQGFYFSQPVSAHEMERMLREGLAMHRQTGSDVPTQGHWRFSAASMP